MNEHIVALPTQLCQNHCLIHHNVVRHECITCIIIPKDFIYYSIFVSHPLHVHFNKQLFLFALLHFFVFSQFHFVTLVFFVSFHPVCFVLTKGPKLLTSTCPFNTSAYSVHDLWALDFFNIYMRTIPKLLEHYSIVLLLYTNLSLLSYLYNRRLLPLWADLVCQPVQRLLYLYTYLYNSNCNMFATYLISLLAHAIYPTYLIKLYVFSNVCILDFTQSPIVQVLTEPSHVLLGVVSVSCGIDRVLPVLRPVCVTHSCHLACMCVCVGGVWRMRVSSA